MKSIVQALVALVSLLIAAALVVFCILFVWGSFAAVVLGCLALPPFVLVLRWLLKPEDKKGKRP